MERSPDTLTFTGSDLATLFNTLRFLPALVQMLITCVLNDNYCVSIFTPRSLIRPDAGMLIFCTFMLHWGVLPKNVDWNLSGFGCMPFSMYHIWAWLTILFNFEPRSSGQSLTAYKVLSSAKLATEFSGRECSRSLMNRFQRADPSLLPWGVP